PLSPLPPRTKPALETSAGGSLTGTFQVKQTFVILDEWKRVICESDFGEAADAVAITTDYLKVTGGDQSTESVSASRWYRTVTGGDVFFHWLDVEGNTQTQFLDDLADAFL